MHEIQILYIFTLIVCLHSGFDMILSLSIENFAVVKSVHVDFQQGLSVVTGETGAGKSIAIDGLSLCLGARADANAVRKNCDKASVVAEFDIQELPKVKHWLTELELIQEEAPNECTIRRVISAEGRSKAFINGKVVTLSQLKVLGQWLVSIHGQHAHHQLLKADAQLHLLDQFANHPDLLSSVKSSFEQYRQIKQHFDELTATQEQRKARCQLLSYQVEELDNFGLQQDEFEQLEIEFKRLSNSQTLLEEAQLSFYRLYENDEYNALSLVQKCVNELEQLETHDATLGPIVSILKDSAINIEEASNELRSYCDDLDIDPIRMQQVEQRYQQAMDFARKHNIMPEALYDTHQALAAEYAELQASSVSLEEVAEQVQAELDNYLEKTAQLSQSRQSAGEALAQQIVESVTQMNMAHTQLKFAVNYDTSQPLHANGLDTIQILVTTNPGQPMDVIENVVSGGELSRIGLAIQVITSHLNQVPTLIFDEVDTGISGPTAAIVGSLLRKLGDSTQVMCVTHLPQVAAQGHQQLFVNKLTDGETTETTMRALNDEQRVRELARLLAGDTLTDSAIANAQEMLQKVS